MGTQTDLALLALGRTASSGYGRAPVRGSHTEARVAVAVQLAGLRPQRVLQKLLFRWRCVERFR